MITVHKSTAGKNGKVRVTFSMSAVDGCERLYLVGWFDEWDESVYPMQRTPDGGWSFTLELEPGCTYQYRFRTLDGRWLNDSSGPPAPDRFGLNTSFIISRNRSAGSAEGPRSSPRR
jgi:1,4-alpha-glucan branching enzyme